MRKNNILCWCYIHIFGCNNSYILILEVVIRKYKKIKILLQIRFHHIFECPNCTTTLLLTMYYYLELLKYLTWSVSVSTQQQNVYKTTRKFPCTNMQAFLKWWLSFQYRTTPIFFSFGVCFQKRWKNMTLHLLFLLVNSKNRNEIEGNLLVTNISSSGQFKNLMMFFCQKMECHNVIL